eukprot:Filipodium_phascolosomae@DN7692_c0_g1_i1.p1
MRGGEKKTTNAANAANAGLSLFVEAVYKLKSSSKGSMEIMKKQLKMAGMDYYMKAESEIVQLVSTLALQEMLNQYGTDICVGWNAKNRRLLRDPAAPPIFTMPDLD